MTDHKRFWRRERIVYRILIVICTVVLVVALIGGYILSECEPKEESAVPVEQQEYSMDGVENGIHQRTGLIAAEGLNETIVNCTSCHSADLIIQNRLNRDSWASTIRWMQETQNLWDLGENEEIIINYLVTNYPATEKGRRENLKNVDWYKLEE
ncbi:monoheme cytochrome C [Poritiphilus flavus]|uniref:Monoheme cytochrome C n=1 Tax=Poritiphilus flavus TaxID=2697053 RepID=A0A6L9E740_9FLAO|nr:monoheme cytochrome C [Poritiphilus flavus]NAS10393.1 monoheme cytochrome C [Poritiphilus flavus]